MAGAAVVMEAASGTRAVTRPTLSFSQIALALLFKSFSQTLWMGAGLLWILDAANNITMEPYRAYLVNGHGIPYITVGACCNFVAFLAAFTMVPFTRRFGPKIMHAICLTLAGMAMLSIPGITGRALLFIPMIGVGLAWASIMGNPYVMLAGSIPQDRVGVYMGIFNMFIVIPMMIQIFTLPLFYNSLLQGNPGNVIRLAGGLLLCAAVAVLFVKLEPGIGRRAAVPVPALH